MSFWNNSDPEERIAYWRAFREEIQDLPLEEQLNKVAEFFANLPIGSRSIDYYTPKSWPTPWEILHYRLFCENAASLLMYHTLTLLLKDSKVEIILIEDDRNRYLVPIIDNKYILNIIPGQISKIHDVTFKVIDRFEDESIPTIR
jgi:hypothetical protein